MKMLVEYLLIALTILLPLAESRLTDNRRLKVRTHHAMVITNICDIADRESKVHCYCENSEPKTATRADCWVFNGGITEDDNIWISFASQPLLERLTFNIRSDGALTFVPVKAFHRLNRIQRFTIQYATIYDLTPYAFANSSSLREIKLTKNKITDLAKFSISHMRVLVNLTLDENRILEIRREVFYELPNLQNLHLSNNNISTVHDGCFEHLNNLIELEMDSNSISVLTRESFKGLSNLARLHLRSNRLEMLGDLTFAELTNLKDLLLDNNDLAYISGRAFDGLSLLSKLSMTGNKLHLVNVGLLESVRGLALLDLRNNRLESLTYETVRPIFENLKSNGGVMYLKGNPFHCDCRMSWIHSLRNETNGESLREALDSVTCIMNTNLLRRIGEKSPKFKEIADLADKMNNANDDNSRDENNLESREDTDMYDDTPELTDDSEMSEQRHLKNLVRIPVELLPCPKELIQDDNVHPLYDEVRAMMSSASIVGACIVTVYVCLVVEAVL